MFRQLSGRFQAQLPAENNKQTTRQLQTSKQARISEQGWTTRQAGETEQPQVKYTTLRLELFRVGLEWFRLWVWVCSVACRCRMATLRLEWV